MSPSQLLWRSTLSLKNAARQNLLSWCNVTSQNTLPIIYRATTQRQSILTSNLALTNSGHFSTSVIQDKKPTSTRLLSSNSIIPFHQSVNGCSIQPLRQTLQRLSTESIGKPGPKLDTSPPDKLKSPSPEKAGLPPERKDKWENIYTLPNFLTVGRFVAAPFLGYMVCTEQYSFACALFLLAGVTDLLDGYIARNWPGK